MICAIHQPNFVPWYPFFQKIHECSIFVLLTYCQFEKNGYQNRFKINDEWHTMRVHHGLEPIRAKKYVDAISDWNKIHTKLAEKYPIVDAIKLSKSNNLALVNVEIIYQICKLLHISTDRIHWDFNTDKTGTDRLVEICKHFGCNQYLSGPSGIRYLEINKFQKNGIELIFQSTHTQRRQSVFDVLSGVSPNDC